MCFIEKIGKDSTFRVGRKSPEEGESPRTIILFATAGHIGVFSLFHDQFLPDVWSNVSLLGGTLLSSLALRPRLCPPPASFGPQGGLIVQHPPQASQWLPHQVRVAGGQLHSRASGLACNKEWLLNLIKTNKNAEKMVPLTLAM